MFSFLFNFFKRKKSILKKAGKAIDSFQKVITSLEEVNNDAKALVDKNAKTIESLTTDNEQLIAAIDKNSQIAANIAKLLEA
jgi:ABC-type transporter Mla subunit MlaD